MGKTTYTKITPLPSNIPRQLALELLHSHEEVIRLNPLVTGVQSIDAPRDASTDEYYSSWYEISQIIAWGLGIKSKYNFKGVFHDQPWGLQTHVYAPMGVDMRNKYRIGGNQPGEPREARELGVETPLDGLYLREDVEITCNVAMMGLVKKEAKEATGIMISRLTRKAELLDEGKLHAMFEDGKLKTARPMGRGDNIMPLAGLSPPASPAIPQSQGSSSPAMSNASFGSAGEKRGYGNYHDMARGPGQHRGWQNSGAVSPGYGGGQVGQSNQAPMPMINELPGSMPTKPTEGASFRSELPGDINFGPQPALPSPRMRPSPTQSPRPERSTFSPQDSTYAVPRRSSPAYRDSSYSNHSGQGSPDPNRLSAPNATGDGRQRQSASSDISSRYVSRRPDSDTLPDVESRFQHMSVQDPQHRSSRQ